MKYLEDLNADLIKAKRTGRRLKIFGILSIVLGSVFFIIYFNIGLVIASTGELFEAMGTSSGTINGVFVYIILSCVVLSILIDVGIVLLILKGTLIKKRIKRLNIEIEKHEAIKTELTANEELAKLLTEEKNNER